MGADRVEEAIGYAFRDRALLTLALTHSSFAREQSPEIEHNERLEFLGDSVLDLIAAERLLHRFPAHAEGRLTKLKSELVNARHLAAVARAVDLGGELRLGRAEQGAGGRSKPGLLADALEALLGAAFLAGLAEGVWPDLAAIEATWQLDATFEPAGDRTDADASHARWLEAVGRSRGWAT